MEQRRKGERAQAVIDPAEFPTGTMSDNDLPLFAEQGVEAIPIPSIRKYQPLMITY